MDDGCCQEAAHIDNRQEDEIGEIHEAVRSNSMSCLMAAFPGCTVMDPMKAFRGDDDKVELSTLTSSAGLSIWKEGDPVHLTETAYGDVADHLLSMITGRAVEAEPMLQRRRLESIVTRSAVDPAQRPVAGWLLGGNQGGQRGRGFLRGQGPRGPRGGRGMPGQQRGGNGVRWGPY